MKRPDPTFNHGDRVAFTREFLRNTGQFTGKPAPTNFGPFARGTVMESEDLAGTVLVRVMWDDGVIRGSLNRNLVLASRLHLEPV